MCVCPLVGQSVRHANFTRHRTLIFPQSFIHTFINSFIHPNRLFINNVHSFIFDQLWAITWTCIFSIGQFVECSCVDLYLMHDPWQSCLSSAMCHIILQMDHMTICVVLYVQQSQFMPSVCLQMEKKYILSSPLIEHK